jgi:hypothetical protein
MSIIVVANSEKQVVFCADQAVVNHRDGTNMPNETKIYHLSDKAVFAATGLTVNSQLCACLAKAANDGKSALEVLQMWALLMVKLVYSKIDPSLLNSYAGGPEGLADKAICVGLLANEKEFIAVKIAYVKDNFQLIPYTPKEKFVLAGRATVLTPEAREFIENMPLSDREKAQAKCAYVMANDPLHLCGGQMDTVVLERP